MAVQQIVVQGKNSAWNLVGSVDAMTGFQIGAKGTVDFGGIGKKDDPNAGVSGNPFAKYAEEILSAGVEALINWLKSVIVSETNSNTVSPSATATTNTPGVMADDLPITMHWNWVDYINANGSTVNYDEGAFFVIISTSDQAPTKANTTDQVTQPALYYWFKKIFDNGGNIAFDQKVWVWIKVHDGGRDPFSTSSFGDNNGSYTIWIDPDEKINDVALKAIVAAPTFTNSAAAQKFRSLLAAPVAGRTSHTALVLNRTAPQHQPS